MENHQKVWFRAGVSTFLTPEEVTKVFVDRDESVIIAALKEGRFQFDGDSYIPDPVISEFNREHGTQFEAQDIDVELPILPGRKCGPQVSGVDLEYMLERDRRAREIFEKLQREDDMCRISDIIAELDEEIAKTVLKLYVYAR